MLVSAQALRDRAQEDVKRKMDDAKAKQAAQVERELQEAKAHAEKLGMQFTDLGEDPGLGSIGDGGGMGGGKSPLAAGRASLAARGKRKSGRINGGGGSGRINGGGGRRENNHGSTRSGGGGHGDDSAGGGSSGSGGGGNDDGGNGDANGARGRGGRSGDSESKGGKGKGDDQNMGGRKSGIKGKGGKGNHGKSRGDEEEIDENDPKARERARIKALTIDWDAISHALPLDKDPESVQMRKDLFERWDVNSNKHLSHSEVDNAMRKLMEELTPGLVGNRGALFEWGRSWKPIIMRAFQRSKAFNAARKSKEKRNDNYVERDEFRLLLVCIRQFFEMFIAFARIDTNVDRKIDKDEVNRRHARRALTWALLQTHMPLLRLPYRV